MRYLSEQDWAYFKKSDGKHDGKKFEALVQDILDLEYDDGIWENTKDSWDGSKDFYLYNRISKKWAECKNYKDKIDLNVLSPTLVMAQIYGIDEILFFSYSPINENTRKKLIQFGDVCKKNLYFYDDIALEQIILAHKEVLFPKFFSGIDKNRYKQMFSPPQIDVYIVHDPLLAYQPSIDEELFQRQFPKSVNLGHVMGIFISVCNRDNMPLPVTVRINQDSNFYNFEFFPDKFSDGSLECIVKAFGQLSKQIFIKQIAYIEQVKFPTIEICYSDSQAKHTTSFQFMEYRCIRVNDGLLIGQSYLGIADKFGMDISSRGRFHGLALSGTSGVGKTRLLTECIQRSLNYEYRVLQFVGFRNSDDRNTPDVSFIVREIIYAAYNIPNEQSLYSAENAILGSAQDDSSGVSTDIQKALAMIHAFAQETDQDAIISLINRYIDTIFERLNSQNFLIGIDNIQFFDATVRFLIERLIERGTATNRKCGLVLIIVFNTDYIPPHSDIMHQLVRLRHLPQFDIPRLQGFADDKEATVFLRQLLTLNVDLESTSLMKIIAKTGRNPFQIKQTVTWLQERKVLIPSNTTFLIKDIGAFYDIIAQIPTQIDAILRDRWAHFIKLHSKEDSLLIVSAIHFMDGISYQQAKWLGVNMEVIDSLIQHNFIKKYKLHNNSPLVFEHDLFEKFFSEQFPSLSSFCVWHIVQKGLNTARLPVLQQTYIQMSINNRPDEEELFELYNQIFSNPLPQKHLNEWLSLLFYLYVNSLCEAMDAEKWSGHMLNICTTLRDRLGSSTALPLYDIAGNLYKNKQYSYLLYSLEYGKFISRYCEALNENGQYSKALDTLKAYMNRVSFQSDNADWDVEWKKLKCILLNRRHCYMRHLCEDPENTPEILTDLAESISLSREINFKAIEYTNHSDWGYMYHSEYKNKATILNIWGKACEYFEKGFNKQSELNYIRKKVQIALINQDFKLAEAECLRGIYYTDTGEYAYEQPFFKNWFYLSLAESLLLLNPDTNAMRIDEAIVSAEEYDALLGTTKKFNIYYLRSLQYYYLGQHSLMLEAFRKAYEDMQSSTYKKFRNKTMVMLTDNLKVMGRPTGKAIIPQLNFIKNVGILHELSVVLSMGDIEYERMLSGYYARSLVRSADNKLNFPCM